MKEFDLKSSLDSLELLREGIKIIRSDNASARSDQKNIRIRVSKPSFPSHYYTQFKDKEEYPSWYKEGFFKKS